MAGIQIIVIIQFCVVGLVFVNALLMRIFPKYTDYIYSIFPIFKPGAWGEKRVSKSLKVLPPNEYITFNDIILRTKSGTTQIDHVVVSIYGVFVIETKTYTGWIFGKEADKEWRQTISHYRNRWGKTVDRNSFPNPIWQNYKHKKVVEKLLSDHYSQLPIIPVVVFAGDAILKKVNTKSPVIYRRELVNFIGEYRTRYIDEDDLIAVSELVRNANESQNVTYTEHIQNLRAEHTYKRFEV